MNKAHTVNFRPGDEVSFAMPSGVLYGSVTRVLGEGDSGAVEIEFEDGRKEIKKVRDRSLSLLRRASGKSEEEERHQDRERLHDLDIERVRRSDQRRR
jgi:adenylosuccinate synthase